MANAFDQRCPDGRALPPLSPNFQTTQLMTPRHLERITIDQPHYGGHLMESVRSTKPPHQNAIQRRIGKMGDNYFFLQKELPVEQTYAKTALQLSQVRPWDQIVERPFKSSHMMDKEVHLPFPQEHPYTSHISRFAIFPDTHGQTSSSLNSSHNQLTTADAQTQTMPGGPNPPKLYKVSQKAGDWGQRVECRYLTTPTGVLLESGVGKMFWDLPRSQRHNRAYTYPAPSLQYSRPPTAPRYLPLPSTIHSPSQVHSPISPSTQNGLNSIHKMLTRTTTYAEQYPSAGGMPRGTQNILRLDYSFRSRGSHRPWTAESRGKYSRVVGAVPTDTDFQTSDRDTHGYRQLQPSYCRDCDCSPPESIPKPNIEQRQEDEPSAESIQKSEHKTEKVDSSTQTEEEYFHYSFTPSSPQQANLVQKLPSLVPTIPEANCTPAIRQVYNPSSNYDTNDSYRPVSGLTPRREQAPRFDGAVSADVVTPRSVDSTRKLMGLYNGFNKTDILRRFHEHFPERAPDLRTYSAKEGKRHIIHGSHAYYFH